MWPLLWAKMGSHHCKWLLYNNFNYQIVNSLNYSIIIPPTKNTAFQYSSYILEFIYQKQSPIILYILCISNASCLVLWRAPVRSKSDISIYFARLWYVKFYVWMICIYTYFVYARHLIIVQCLFIQMLVPHVNTKLKTN